MEKELIFALDIGTRKVAGIVAEEIEGDKLKIVNFEIIEHESRTMLDGQVHNVMEVARVVRIVKERLEKKTGRNLKKVGVAVAGRALQTFQKKIEKRIPPDREITKNDMFNLEFEAVSELINEIKTRQHADLGKSISQNFNCVGYSVVYYELDGMRIANLVGHFGRFIAVEVIATFLPRSVIDAILSVLRKADLEVVTLTLEPIAAINVIVPENMRKLNIVLVDIGAGTSDLAITRNGTIIAYGMVPEAGDEITEYFCEKFLMDFNTGDMVKRQLSQKPKVSFVNILGQSKELNSLVTIEELRPRVRALADSIAKMVMELNSSIPQAVVCVGGGALTPLIQEELALALKMDIDRVGIRTPVQISWLEGLAERLKNPDMVTPFGITHITHHGKGLKFITVEVNNRKVEILDMNQQLDVLSVLLASGADTRKLYGRPGLAMTFEVNNKPQLIKGKLSKPATIKLNGKNVPLTHPVAKGDHIEYKDAEDGTDATAKISDVVSLQEINAEVNGKSIKLKTKVFMDGIEVGLDASVPDRAKIVVEEAVTVKMALKAMGIDHSGLNERDIVVSVDGEPRVLTQSNFTLLLNGKSATLNTRVESSDKVTFDAQKPTFYRISDVVKLPAPSQGITVNLNEQKYNLGSSPGKVLMNGKEVSPEEFLIDRAEIKVIPSKDSRVIVSHVFPFLDIDPLEQRGKALKIFVDGKPAGFTTPLNEGSEIKIYFETRPE